MDLQNELKQKLGEELFEKRLAETIKSFEGLVNRNAAIKILAKDEGLITEEEKFVLISEIEKNAKTVTIKASVVKIWPTATYSSGKKSRVYELSDQSGKIPLILWNKDIERFSGLRINDQIKVDSAYESGGELHLGYNGKVVLIKRGEFDSLSSLAPKYDIEQTPFLVNVRGNLVEKCSEEGIFSIGDGVISINCALLDLSSKDLVNQSVEIIIEKGTYNGQLIEITGNGRLLCRKKPPETVTVLGINQGVLEEVEILTDKGKMTLTRKEALETLGIMVASDIKMSTVLSLKKDSLINSKITLSKQ